jgi:hypothetical protein
MRRFRKVWLCYGAPVTLALGGLATLLPAALMSHPPVTTAGALDATRSSPWAKPAHDTRMHVRVVIAPAPLPAERLARCQQLLEQLANPDQEGRPALVEELAQYQDLPQAKAALRNLLVSASSFEEQRAAIEWATEATEAVTLLPTLEGLAATSPDRRVRQYATRALKRIRRRLAAQDGSP